MEYVNEVLKSNMKTGSDKRTYKNYISFISNGVP